MTKGSCEINTNEVKKGNIEYSVGLDIGTSSVGWSVIDKNYKLLKKDSQNMWGSYLFEEGESAAERRAYRSNRRRMNRRKRRVSLLKMLMGEIVLDKDENFFMKLEKGHVKNEEANLKYNLFNGDYNEKEYYKEFPTIYHLRNKLCNNKEKADPRLLYLAIHHIIKYRGNFLYEGQAFNISDKQNSLKILMEILSDIVKMYSLEESSESEVSKMLDILVNTKMTKKARVDDVTDLLKNKFDNKAKAKAFANLLLGYKCDLAKLFDETCVSSDEKALNLSFTSNKYEEELAMLENVSQEKGGIVLQCNIIYSFIQLKDILNVEDTDKVEEPSISASMIKKYDQHKGDLEILKKIINKYFDKEAFTQVFKDKSIKGNYYNYINNKANTPQNDENSFSKYIEKLLRSNSECLVDLDVINILNKIENKVFMPKQNTKDNGVIPYQLNEAELIEILNNQKEYYPILETKFVEICSLLTFRIPYYFGPLSNINDKFAWIIKNNNKEIVYPWNYDEVVDVEQSAEKFIKRMTNQCTYLWDKEVLPKNSLIYSKYEVLNELNKIDVIKRDKSGSLKREVFQDLFMNTERVTEKKLRKFLMDKGYDSLGEIKGFQKEGEFASSLSPWIKFKKIFPNNFYEKMDDIEIMIEWISVYEDKNILKKRLIHNFNYLEKEEIKQICNLKFTGWGRLSKKLLVDMKCKDSDEGAVSILDVLYNTNKNFMQIITDKKYDFKEKIELHNSDANEEINISERINQIACSPSVKKGIRQSVKVLEDIVKVMKGEPTNIFIEFAREDQNSRRTDSRLYQIAKKYEKIENKEEFKQVIKELNEKSKDKSGIKNKTLLLYFLQGAKCLYTGEGLEIDQLHLYQVDHILPQSYIKDDSIDNLALVKSSANQYKGDDLLIDSKVQENQKSRWLKLRKIGLISEKKYINLTRKTVSPLEEMNFVNRQLVETRQITKHVANIFKQTYPNTLIGSIKAGLSSDFRKKFDVYKIRNLNDYHHAHDSYIASVIGIFVLKAYPSLKREFIFDEFVQLKDFKEKLRKMQKKVKHNNQKSLYGFILNQMDDTQLLDDETGEVIWDDEIKKTILSAFEYKDCHIVKKAEETLGGMHKLTLKIPDKEGNNKVHKLISRGGDFHNVYKYGGYTNINYAYMVVVSYLDQKKRIMKKLLSVPIAYKDNEKLLLEYLRAELNSKEVKIKNKILMNQKIKINNGYYYLASAAEWNNATQLFLSKKSKKTIYMILKGKEISQEDFERYLDEHLNKLEKYYPLYKNSYDKLIQKRENILLLAKIERMQFVNQMLILTAANKANANLAIGDLMLASTEGRVHGKNCNLDECEFIFSSPTGLYTRKVKL